MITSGFVIIDISWTREPKPRSSDTIDIKPVKINKIINKNFCLKTPVNILGL